MISSLAAPLSVMLRPPFRAPRAAIAAIALAAGVPASLAAQQVVSRAAEPISSEAALVTFDSVWNRIRATHYDSAMRGVDWNAVRDSLRPQAARATTLGALRRTITATLATLGESHFVLIPREAADAVDPDRVATGADADVPGDVGVSLRLLGDTLVVSAVRAGGPADRAGVEPGWTLDSAGAFGAARALASIAASPGLSRPQAMLMLVRGAGAQLAGPSGTTVDAVFRDHDGRRVAMPLVRAPMAGTPVRFGNLPTMFVEVSHERRPLPGRAGCAGVIRLTTWMTPAMAQLDSAVDAMRDCDGVIVDLRGNPGGVGAMVMGFGGHFVDSTYALGEMKTRSNRLRFVANPRRADTRGQAVTPYAGPLAILVDSLSMSTSEIFAAGMQSIGRARLFGENTPGLALPAMVIRLPTGDGLMHVVADFTDPSGRRIEGAGAAPDVIVPLSRADLRRGIDAPLAAAIGWIAGSPRPGGAAGVPVSKDPARRNVVRPASLVPHPSSPPG